MARPAAAGPTGGRSFIKEAPAIEPLWLASGGRPRVVAEATTTTRPTAVRCWLAPPLASASTTTSIDRSLTRAQQPLPLTHHGLDHGSSIGARQHDSIAGSASGLDQPTARAHCDGSCGRERERYRSLVSRRVPSAHGTSVP